MIINYYFEIHLKLFIRLTELTKELKITILTLKVAEYGNKCLKFAYEYSRRIFLLL